MTTKNTTPVKVTINQMIEIFKGISRPTFVHFVTETTVKMNKKDQVTKDPNPFHNQVTKHFRGNVLVGIDYGKRVKNNMEKEGIDPNFVVKPNWFEHLTKSVVYKKSDPTCIYFQYEFFKNSRPKVEFSFQGNPIDKVLFERFMEKKSEPTNQPQEKKVYPQTYSVESIREFTHKGTKYIVES